jgi:hypothetical protein
VFKAARAAAEIEGLLFLSLILKISFGANFIIIII